MSMFRYTALAVRYTTTTGYPKRNRLGLYASLAVALVSACAPSVRTRGLPRVPAGSFYPGTYINITAPRSDGWHLVESSDRGMTFARSGTASGESFTAQVLIFPLEPTSSPEEFEALVVEQATRAANTQRFSTTDLSHSYSEARGFPCVKMHNVSIDREAQIGGGRTEVLILENEHLYCRHPVRTATGFVISYSHRGRVRHPQLQAEAMSFIEGVQVPGAPATPRR